MKKAMINYVQNDKFDDLYTPEYAVTPLLNYLSTGLTIWECTDFGDSKITKILSENNYVVISTDIVKGFDFLNDTADFHFDMIISNPPYCYDSETEVLTMEGYKKIYDVNINDKIMSLNQYTNEISYDNINEIISNVYNGEMIHFKQKSIDLLVTPNHRMYAINNNGVLLKRNNIYRKKHNTVDNDTILAEDIKANHYFKRAGFIWKGNTISTFTIPSVSLIYNKTQKVFEEIVIDIKDWLAFFGIWIAEGCTRGSTKKKGENHKGKQKRLYEVSLKQKEPAANQVRLLLSKLPFIVKERKNEKNVVTFSISSVQLWHYLSQFGTSFDKHIPKEIKNLSVDLLKIVYYWYMFGDGCYSNNTESFYTVSKKLADDLSEIVLKIGSSTNIHNIANGYKGVVSQKNIGMYKKRNTVNYKGLIYCLSLKNNNMLLVRRNGKMIFSGNSLKNQFLTKCYEYNKPFALLLPLTALESAERSKLFKKYGISVVILDRRVNFSKTSNNVWFNTSWFCWNLDKLSNNSIVFETLNIPIKQTQKNKKNEKAL